MKKSKNVTKKKLKGIIIITVPVGNISPNKVKESLKSTNDNMKSLTVKANNNGYEVVYLPTRLNVDPKIEVINLYV